ncbi:MAG TPA: hypothetical protein VF040_12945 [Ktedonobacterales bacterium]
MPGQEPRSHFLRNGLIFGAILALLGLSNTLIQVAAGAYHVVASNYMVNVTNSGGTSLLGCVLFLATLALTFVAGLLTARDTGKAGSGALSGLMTGIFGSLFGSIATIVVLVVFVAPGLQAPPDVSMSLDQIQTLFVVVTVGVAVLGLLLDAGVGAGMGALGGLLGARSRNPNPSPLPPAPYGSGYPYPGNPGYPSYPGMTAQPDPTPQQTGPYPNAPQYPQPGNPPPVQQ